MEIAIDVRRRVAIIDGVTVPLHRQGAGWCRRKLDDLVRWAGSKSNYFSKGFLNLFAGGVAFAAPSNEYVALLTATPDDTSTGATITETDYGTYARVQIGTGNNQTDAWNAATGTTTATVTNKNAITGSAATTASTNPLTAIAILDSATIGAGNILWWATITSTAIAIGDTPKINAGALSIVED
jgi:hypothetical protein